MESGTKMRLSSSQLDKLVRVSFGTGLKEAVELTDGWANTAYRIELADRRKAVLKVAPPPATVMMRYEENMMQTEVDVLRRLEGIVPVPRVYACDNSRILLSSEYFFMEYLDGTPYNVIKPSLPEQQRDMIEFQLGEYTRIINEVKGTHFGPYGAPLSYGTNWMQVFMQMMQNLFADAQDLSVELPMKKEEVSALVANCADALNEVTEPCLVHWDLWDGNVFIRDGSIIGLIDFERALWGDPLLEAYFRGRSHSPAHLRGYGITELTAAQESRRRLYDLYLDLILLIECSFRRYDNPAHEEWACRNLAESWERFTV
ncbi:MAG: aminoglycoside phosphotransferase family protein [Paenibacillaceae bacterium]|jgi:aminoglycoside phosphotransferase (APT) family kinase protein|nr:aminoglycoside phosphotransferase family protein [Paenibacillaceae bacterium]